MWKGKNISRMVGEYCLITIHKSEYLQDQNIITITTTSSCDMNNRSEKQYESSSIVILCICALNNQKMNT